MAKNASASSGSTRSPGSTNSSGPSPDSAAPNPTQPARALTLGRKLAYSAVLTVFLLALLLGGLELCLRIAGYGHSPHFARREKLPDGSVVWRDNRWCTAPFFSEKLVRRPQPFRLSEKKSPGTLRIFVIGSSAAMGDPEASFSISRMLETQLHAAYPDKHFEVINAAITAINSHLARGIAADCARLEPDLFIVYEGHNEIIGPFGPAGVFTSFLRHESFLRAAVWLKGTRTGQLIAALTSRELPAHWRGLEMFLDRQLRATDPRLGDVRAHLRANLLAIAASGHAAGADTLVATVLANQRDFAPFLSLHRAGLSPAARRQWETDFSAAEAATRAGDFSSAEKSYRAALALDDQSAELNFRLGRLALQNGRDADARSFLSRALDLDTLRFRTDSTLNQTIRDLAATHAPGLRVVDLADTISQRSPHGVPGDELLYEHVHLSFRGAYEVSRELFPAITADLSARGLLPSAPTELPLSIEETRVRLAFTLHEQAMIWLTLDDRFRQPPFSTQSDAASRQDTARRRVIAATDALKSDSALPALRAVYERALSFAPDDWVLLRNTGMMLLARHQPTDALPYLEKAAAWIDDDADTLIALARVYRALGRKADATRTYDLARRLEPGHPEFAAPAPEPVIAPTS